MNIPRLKKNKDEYDPRPDDRCWICRRTQEEIAKEFPKGFFKGIKLLHTFPIKIVRDNIDQSHIQVQIKDINSNNSQSKGLANVENIIVCVICARISGMLNEHLKFKYIQ